MIINNNQEEIKSLGFDNSTKFVIDSADAGKIFRLLGTSVYADKEGSIVREYLSNAIDSQIVIGKGTEPVYIKYYDGKIEIKDNGRGMSPYIIDNIYKKLGKSDKSDNPELIGGYGAGRFSLLSYTKIFYVNTISDGILYNYIVSESVDGVPDIDLINQEETTQNNGTTIIFDLIKLDDVLKFKKAIQNQLKYFETVITEGFDLNNNYRIIRGRFFTWRTDQTNNDGLNINWGNTSYPISWNEFEIPKINVNCGLYFPTNTPFAPTISREQLENNTLNKQLIREGIINASKELYDLWKEQQIIDSFFEYYKTGRKIIKFDENQLDVTDIISEEYIFAPLVETHINNKKFKNQLWDLFHKFFNYRKNSRWYSNSWEQIKTCSHIYHTKNCANVSQGKLAKASWKGCIVEKENLNYFDIVSKIYDTSICEIKIVDGERVIVSNIDWKSEIDSVISCIWKEIEENTIDIHSLTFKVERNRNVIDNSQVRGKFSYSAYTQNTWEIKQLSFIKQFRYVVVTTDPLVYDKLLQLKFEPTTRRKGVTSKVDRYFCAVLTNKKYLKRLDWCYSYEDFLKTNLMKKYFYKYQHYLLRENYKINLDDLRKWVNIHPTYENKFSYYKEFFKKKPYKHIPNKLEQDFLNIYSIDEMTNEYNTIRDKVLKLLSFGNSSGEIKYKLLYQGVKQKLNKTKC